MSDHPADPATQDESTERAVANQISPVTADYKLLGQQAASAGVGDLGQNDATSGTPIGVQGAVPQTAGGFGLATPDDARIEGLLDTNETDFVVEAGTASTGDATNVILGHEDNAARDGATGVVIGGGGEGFRGDTDVNLVYDSYGTIGGGSGNEAGDDNGFPHDARYATVAGGDHNMATAGAATVGGGNNNEARKDSSTVAGGDENVADVRAATVGGGGVNKASGDSSTVPSGSNNIAAGTGSFAVGVASGAADDDSFVWNDGSGASDSSGDISDRFESSTSAGSTPTGVNTFSVKATSSVRFVTSADNSSHAWIDTSGNVKASGTTDFVERVETPARDRVVTYSAVEAPTVRTAVSGGTTVEDGYAAVDLPADFGWVTAAEAEVVVQVTPHASEDVAPRVTERSTRRIVIEDDGDGPATDEVSYTVKGTRAGQGDKPTVTNPGHT